jgi:hypothetical protein
MKLTRERKFYVAVFALALVALVADRVFFNGGGGGGAAQEASAAADHSLVVPSAERSSTGSGAAQGGAAHGSASSGAESVTRLLESIRKQRDLDIDNTPDVFAKTITPTGVLPTERQIRANSLIEQFSRHRLTSVMTDSRGGAAMVDGQIVHLGQTFDRFTLIAIDSQSALFECEDVQVRLMLGGESKGSSGGSSGGATDR